MCQRGSPSSHLWAIAKLSSGWYSGVVWPPPCASNNALGYVWLPDPIVKTCVSYRQKNLIGIRDIATFTVAKVKLLAYVIVNLNRIIKEKKCKWCPRQRADSRRLDCNTVFIWQTFVYSAGELNPLYTSVYVREKKKGVRWLNPAAWPLRCHALQSSTMEKFSDLIHACVPRNGTIRSWSPLYPQRLQWKKVQAQLETSVNRYSMLLWEVFCIRKPFGAPYPFANCPPFDDPYLHRILAISRKNGPLCGLENHALTTGL